MVDAPVKYEPVIGLEVHAQLLTISKLFCGCAVEYGADPNTRACPVCLGYPGALPTINRRAVEYAVRMILAVGGDVQEYSQFARKNYLYPDLPKGYQISQFEKPLGVGGGIAITMPKYSRMIGLDRIHVEEDAGKLLHPEQGEDYSRIDFNRCGVPLIEIVTEPDIRSPGEAHEFLRKLKQILQYLDICSGDMEKGALRCDANISLRIKGGHDFGVRTELKNLNSFRAVEQALAFEIDRQAQCLETGSGIARETLLWDESIRQARPMREKEGSEDYRYFPEPDLPPMIIDREWIEQIGADIPELPDERRNRIMEECAIPEYDAGVLTESKAVADYFEQAASGVVDKKLASNWVMVEVLGAVGQRKISIEKFTVRPKMLAQLLRRIESGEISGRMAKEIFQEMVDTGRSAGVIIDTGDLRQISDGERLAEIVADVIAENERQVQEYRQGNTKLMEFFVGQVMARTEGRANPKMARKILKEKLND